MRMADITQDTWDIILSGIVAKDQARYHRASQLTGTIFRLLN